MLQEIMLKRSGLYDIYEKVLADERLSFDDGVRLYETRDLTSVGFLANIVRERKNGNHAYFVYNQHLNPTNICEYTCMFCSFARLPGEEGGYLMSLDDIEKKIRELDPKIKEIHIVSGLHPDLPYEYYTDMLKLIRKIRPDMNIKAFTAVEIEYYAQLYNKTIEDVLHDFIECGLDAMPGGGAEILAERVRKKICDEKATAEGWLNVHRAAHRLGLITNATMLYGHIENYDERVDHLVRLRELQDQTGGFSTFIPLAYQHDNNKLGKLPVHTSFEDLKNVAVPRLMLDNFPHIKAYWVVIGHDLAQISLSYGADEIEGTIVEEIIMNMAGSKSGQGMTVQKLTKLIRAAGRIPVQRDALYNIIKVYDDNDDAEELEIYQKPEFSQVGEFEVLPVI